MRAPAAETRDVRPVASTQQIVPARPGRQVGQVVPAAEQGLSAQRERDRPTAPAPAKGKARGRSPGARELAPPLREAVPDGAVARLACARSQARAAPAAA